MGAGTVEQGGHAQGSQKTRMTELSGGRKRFRIRLAVLIQYRSVTDTQPDTQPPSHVAVAITLNAQASSLKRKKTSNMKTVKVIKNAPSNSEF